MEVYEAVGKTIDDKESNERFVVKVLPCNYSIQLYVKTNLKDHHTLHTS